MDVPLKPIVWVGSSRKDLRGMVEDVKDEIGRDLQIDQQGGIPMRATPIRGFGGASVLEIVVYYNSDTYRTVYTVRFESAVYVLHVFMKKSHERRKTPQRDIELIRARLKRAEEIERERQQEHDRDDRL